MSYKERFRINGLPISDIALQAYLESLAPLIEHLQLTEFEVLTLIAWQYFKDEHPDFVVIETGLGGRLDATVVCTPLVTCITSISMDHIEILGPTLVDIAKEKAGIIKDGIPCYLLDQENEVLSVLQTIANERHVPLHIIPRSNHDYLQTNWALAAATVTSLLPLFSLPKQLPPRIGGRQQVLRSQPYILADAAHNLEGILALIKILKEKSFKGSIWYSATRRPELATIIDELYRITKDLVIFEFDHPRAAQKSDYPDDTFSPNKEKYVSLKDRKVFIRKALKEVSQQICVTGSIYFLGEMIPLLRE
jgi:dihydrofolate synthase/folylpolyglutamate synthase